MFSQKEFIEASRDFVCVRLESYESDKHQKIVRSFLHGRFANTAFGILAPDGKTQLSATGRSPSTGLGQRSRRRGARNSNDAVVSAMKRIAAKYPTRGAKEHAVVQDFHSFRQAVNAASGDQRLLLYVVSPAEERPALRERLREFVNHDKVVGRLHTDFWEADTDSQWRSAIKGGQLESGLFVIRADKFGQSGSVVAELPLETSIADLMKPFLEANRKFGETETRKVYSEHVQEGRRQRIHFENGMPYGEDRDGDGQIDRRRGPGRAGNPDRRRGSRALPPRPKR